MNEANMISSVPLLAQLELSAPLFAQFELFFLPFHTAFVVDSQKLQYMQHIQFLLSQLFLYRKLWNMDLLWSNLEIYPRLPDSKRNRL